MTHYDDNPVTFKHHVHRSMFFPLKMTEIKSMKDYNYEVVTSRLQMGSNIFVQRGLCYLYTLSNGVFAMECSEVLAIGNTVILRSKPWGKVCHFNDAFIGLKNSAYKCWRLSHQQTQKEDLNHCRVCIRHITSGKISFYNLLH